jgi:AcrR family transcriptional regulator
VSDESPRSRLLEAAMHLLSDGGPEALQARRIAAETGASTMAVYTHFGGMRELIRALAREGFVRFGQRLGQAPRSDDPVADLFMLGLAYRDHALENPQLYRLMFGVTPPDALGRRGGELTVSALSSDLPEGGAAFAQLVEAVERTISAGRIRPTDPGMVAAQIWSTIHGYVLLEIAGFFDDGLGVEQVLLPLGVTLAVGLGDTAEAAERSAARLRGSR